MRQLDLLINAVKVGNDECNQSRINLKQSLFSLNFHWLICKVRAEVTAQLGLGNIHCLNGTETFATFQFDEVFKMFCLLKFSYKKWSDRHRFNDQWYKKNTNLKISSQISNNKWEAAQLKMHRYVGNIYNTFPNIVQ